MAIAVTPDICTPLNKLHFKSYVQDTAPTLHFSLMSVREPVPPYCVKLYGYSFETVRFGDYCAVKFLVLLPSSSDALKEG